jgi:hypothetical protein
MYMYIFHAFYLSSRGMVVPMPASEVYIMVLDRGYEHRVRDCLVPTVV